MENITKDPILFLDTKVPDTELEKFQKIIEKKYNIKFGEYIFLVFFLFIELSFSRT